MDGPRTPEERAELGRSLRERAPLESHADWSPRGERDPVGLIEGQNEGRISWLVPVRRHRMSRSPFAFYRGAARIMAFDLQHTPVSGLHTQICGDAHLANFGSYASPERRLVFDLNDFDETLRGPWEWDVKRLAASLVIAGRFNGLSAKASRKIARRCVKAYRRSMGMFAVRSLAEIWYSVFEMNELIDAIEDKSARKAARKAAEKAREKDHRHALRKLAEEVDGTHRIRSEPPLLVPLRDLPLERIGVGEKEILESFDAYKASVRDDHRHFLDCLRPVDYALKVVGVGSVGTACAVMLLEGRDRRDPFFLQVKQAGASVLEEFLPATPYESHGRRVVEGQRLMQAVSDLFLGWTVSPTTGNHYYWRQLKDWKGSMDAEDVGEDELDFMARDRGWTLARAHARAGDPIAIAAYMGRGKTFEKAIAAFAERYADQNEEDFEAFDEAVRGGRLEACELA